MCQNVAESGTNMCQNMCLNPPPGPPPGGGFLSLNQPSRKIPEPEHIHGVGPNSPLYKGRCTPDSESSFRITAPGSAPCLSLQSHVSRDSTVAG